jgi:hypothetical protein
LSEKSKYHKITGIVLYASDEVGLELISERNKYMSMFCHHITGERLNVKTVHRSSEDVAKFTHLGTTTKNQNRICEEI